MHGHVIVKESVQVPTSFFFFLFFLTIYFLQLSDLFVQNLCNDIEEKKNKQTNDEKKNIL